LGKPSSLLLHLTALNVKKMTPAAMSFARLNTVTVRTPDLAFGNFSFYSRPGEAQAYHPGDGAGFLPSHMVKLKNTHIVLTAINAGMTS
jgi:hypothetical protein